MPICVNKMKESLVCMAGFYQRNTTANPNTYKAAPATWITKQSLVWKKNSDRFEMLDFEFLTTKVIKKLKDY